MARKPKGRPISGVLVLNKPGGMTSNRALQIAKRLFYVAKAGHTGSLDPLATGVLPLCFGDSTKFSQYLLDADKTYESTFRLGERTDTSDSDGEIVETHSALHITEAMVLAGLMAFKGEISQVPSMFSALKKDGQPLYKLARQGIEVERKARQVTVYALDLLAFRPGVVAEVDVRVSCSKGTYIRSIAEDLGQALKVGGHVSRLHRTQAGPFTLAQSVSIDKLEELRAEAEPEVLDPLLLPVDAPVANMPKLALPEATAYYFRQGNPVMDAQAFALGGEGDKVRVFDQAGEFLGIGELSDDGRVAPKRLVATNSAD
ncbi:tRNA pseudouridine(55) synthase TruB [Simiduia curdlanivorans]|uniref:tRNA pseudouridine synthase B n=1 Tax=Simiduia curdlanivorans TaxID=1492769 RepID=A0ABV8V4C9_9GAMM|nr:tRNA pseudouridine(55) synthase TruB [Simiduia curdlanivorans]MDN3640889.1 tRNA pseudouridine(55) synthase TruB [Simiduia curdlanivorans]